MAWAGTRKNLNAENAEKAEKAKAKGESFHLSADNRVFQSLRTIFEEMEEGRAALLNTPSKNDANWMKRGADTERACLGIA